MSSSSPSSSSSPWKSTTTNSRHPYYHASHPCSSSSSQQGPSSAIRSSSPPLGNAEEDWLISDEEDGDCQTRSEDGQEGPFVDESRDLVLTRDMASRESAKVYRTFYDTGYREGITSGKLSRLQQGFDEGFNLSSAIGKSRGELRGQAHAADYFLTRYKARSGPSSAVVGAGMRRFRDRDGDGREGSSLKSGGTTLAMQGMSEEDKENTRARIRSIAAELDALRIDQLLEPDLDARKHEEEHAGREFDTLTMGESDASKAEREDKLPGLQRRLEFILGALVA